MSSDMGSPFVDTVSRFIGQHQLLHPGKKYLVALSGGADSVALLRVMRLLGYDIEAAHCNFRLRGEESDRDEAFCADLCHELSVPMHIAHFDTSAYAEAHHLSIEMAARNLRYGYFRQLMNDIGAEAVVVAHHKDDSVETMLINLIRGTGIKGLTGISPKRDGVVRPLLCVDREQILGFLSHIHQDYVTDSTNLVDDVVRNKIRLNILPLMREINPSVTEAMAATAEKLSMVSAVYDSAMEELSGQARVPLADGKVIAYELGKITSEGLLFHILQPDCAELHITNRLSLRVGHDFVDDLGVLGYRLDGRPGRDDGLGIGHIGIGILVNNLAILAIDRHLYNIEIVPVVGELVKGQLVGHGLVIAAVTGIEGAALGHVKRVAHPHQETLAIVSSGDIGMDCKGLTAVGQHVKPVVGSMGSGGCQHQRNKRHEFQKEFLHCLSMIKCMI